MSERVVGLLRQAGITGWRTYDVELVSKHGDPIPGYTGLTITGRCDPSDYRYSEIVLRHYPGGLFPHFRGRYFAEESWDGSDLFMERPDARGAKTGYIYATEPTRETFVRARTSNVRFECACEVETTVLSVEVGNPHRFPADIHARIARARVGVSANDA